jgi:Predicted pyridoxal phosphate-dependent enzyme apparently involved in regulation of cell wall biogenesis
MISLAIPSFDEEEKKALCSVIDSGWVTTGEKVCAFEQAFAKAHGVNDAVAVTNATAGLHLCLAALGIGHGDYVLVPSLTFVATVNAILYVGAIPVFVDIESLDCPHISLEDARHKLTSRVKAVIVMHYAGYAVDITRWREFADSYGIFFIEDAAHAPGLNGVAQLSDAAAFSFFGNKNMTTGEGGMVTALNPETISRVRSLRSHGMTTSTLDRHLGHAFKYDVTMLGFNYRMDELRAAVGLCQLAKLEQWNVKRRKLVLVYRDLFERHCPELSIPFTKTHETVAHLFPVLLPDAAMRKTVMVKLREADIQSSIHYLPVHRFSYYREKFPGIHLANTEEFSSRVVTLPLYPDLHEKDLELIVSAVTAAIRER